MAAFAVDLSGLPASLREPLVKLWRERDQLRYREAVENQKRIAKAYREAALPGTAKDGFGPVTMAIDPYFVSQYRRTLGEEIFQDDQFVKWLMATHEEVRVPEASTKLQFGYKGTARNRTGYAGKIVCGPATTQARNRPTPVAIIPESDVARKVSFHKKYELP